MKTHISTLPNGERLKISYTTGFKNLSIEQNGESIAYFPNPDEFRNGMAVQTKAGEKVTLVIDHAGLAAWYNGTEIITGQKSGTIDYFTHAIYGTFAMAGFALLRGILAVITLLNATSESGNVDTTGLAIWTTILASLTISFAMAGFAWWAKKSNQKLYLGLALGATIVGILGGAVPLLFGIALVIYQGLGIQKGSLFASNQNDDSTILDRFD